MQRFINSMKNGDWVVVPHSGSKFYIAEVASSAYYDDSKQARETDSCYRRKVRWLNGKKPLEKKLAKARLVARMKTQQTSAEASDLIDEIYDVMRHASRQVSADERLGSTLRQDFKAAVRKRIAELITPQRLELLVKRVLEANGATVRRIGTRSDKGVDLIATFEVGRVTQLEIGVQVKHHNGLTENKWIDQLKKGLEEEDLAYGWLVTTGEFAADAPDYREKKLQGTGLRIDQVDGGALADLIVDSGVDTLG